MVVVKPKNYFWLSNGMILKDLYELAHAMKIMDDPTFMHHVNSEKNDFYNWTKDILNEQALAKKLLESKTREEMSLAIERRISQLSKAKNKKESKKQIINQIIGVHNV